MAWQDIVAGALKVIDPGLGAALDANKKLTGEYVPGINVGNIGAQAGSYVGLAPQGDYDISDAYTLSGRPGQTDVLGISTKTANDTSVPGYTGLSDTELAQQERDAESTYAANQTAAQKAASERGYYQSQIDALNSLLGYIDTSKTKGLESLGSSYADQVAQAQKAYADQELANQKAKLGGIEQVDQYAGQNYNSLMSLLRNAGAGSSSVARDLMPSLVARAAGTRRQNVFNTAGENQAAIDTARTAGMTDIENKRRSAEQSFLDSIGRKQIEALGQKSGYELQRDMADGTGYDAARAASDATQSQISSRYNELAGLFDKYKPTYSAVTTPDMAKYTADKAAIKVGGGQSDPSMYYSNLFKKKQEQGL